MSWAKAKLDNTFYGSTIVQTEPKEFTVKQTSSGLWQVKFSNMKENCLCFTFKLREKALAFGYNYSTTAGFENKTPEEVQELLAKLLNNKRVPRLTTIEKWQNDRRGLAGVALDHFGWFRHTAL